MRPRARCVRTNRFCLGDVGTSVPLLVVAAVGCTDSVTVFGEIGCSILSLSSMLVSLSVVSLVLVVLFVVVGGGVSSSSSPRSLEWDV